MESNIIQSQYNEVIAPHYDQDPQSVIGRSLDQAIEQIRRQPHLTGDGTAQKVLDLGMGTGKFFEKLKSHTGHLQPYGIDLSEKMIAIAAPGYRNSRPLLMMRRILMPILAPNRLTSFARISSPALFRSRCWRPKIRSRLADGGYWSLIGGTRAGFPTLQKKAQLPGMRWLFGRRTLNVDHHVCNPADHTEVVQTLESSAFVVRECQTFTPRVDFRNLNEFMDFAYYAGWLAPFIQALGLHRARAIVRAILNVFFFPVQDHHSIEIVLAQKA